MKTTINIDPVTRISGFMDIELTLENNEVIDAKCKGLLYRGFEKMLVNKSPLDAIYFTERICGICSVAHGYCSSVALEDMLNITPSFNRKLIRDIIHCSEFLQNHIRHFYLYMMPDYVSLPIGDPMIKGTPSDLRLPEDISRSIANHYVEGIKFSKMAHELQTILTGKAPHGHGIFVGGGIANITPETIIRLKYMKKRIAAFVETAMVPDAEILKKYYGDYLNMGISYENFISFGLFNNYPNTIDSYVSPSSYIDGVFEPLKKEDINETIDNSWYKIEGGKIYPEISPSGYSFVKAPRYRGNSMEVGPLSRMFLSGQYKNGFSTMDRIMARALETNLMCEYLEKFISLLEPKETIVEPVKIPLEGEGLGLIDTTRGSLLHKVSIKDSKISSYDIITPSCFNCSPTDSKGIKGPLEKALLGTKIKDVDIPIEAARIVRSFDPCISCAVH